MSKSFSASDGITQAMSEARQRQLQSDTSRNSDGSGGGPVEGESGGAARATDTNYKPRAVAADISASNQSRRGAAIGAPVVGPEVQQSPARAATIGRQTTTSRNDSFTSVDSTWATHIGSGAAGSSSLAIGSSGEATGSVNSNSNSSSSSSGGGLTRRQLSSAPGGQQHPTSNTQRLSSIEILNENKQRQLQLEQQESFKQHLEQRQRYIQQQQKQQQLQPQQHRPSFDFIGAAYQVETSAPEYVRMATAPGGTGGALNPFAASDETAGPRSASRSRPTDLATPRPDSDSPTTVSGRSGFLATLMGAGSEGAASGADGSSSATRELLGASGGGGSGAAKQQVFVDESGEELDSSGADGAAPLESRYSKVAQSGACSYNYSGEGDDGVPFYRKDLSTLLHECRNSRRLVILIVAVALLLDNMLLTAVVPIIPAYLYKLRVEREHRELLAGGQQATVAKLGLNKTAARFAALDVNRDGYLDEDELQSELDRRINQSLASAQDRFSGSFFQPRVVDGRRRRPSRLDGRRGDLEDDDDRADDDDDDRDDQDDDRDDNVGGGRAEGGRRSGRRSKSADDADELNGSDSRRGPPKLARYPREADATTSATRTRSSTKSIALNDDYEPTNDGEDDETDGDSATGPDKSVAAENQKNGKLDKEPTQRALTSGAQASKAAAQVSEAVRAARSRTGDSGSRARTSRKSATASMSATREANRKSAGSDANDDKNGDGDGDGDDDDEEDDDDVADGRRPDGGAMQNDALEDADDEDLAASRRWRKLRNSLANMAQKSGNDTEALAGLCLSMALGRSGGYSEGAEAAATGDRQRAGKSQPGGRRRAGGQSKWADEPQRTQKARVDRMRAPGLAERNGQQPVSTTPSTTIVGEDEVIIDHQDIVDESFEVGVMFASKPIVQAIANPFVGAITNRVGFTLPMFLGFTIMFLSTLVFAFGSTYATLFLARAIQGVGSACTSVAGMSMIADRFPDDAERGNAMAVALGGLALGVVIGPPFGGFMYEFFGKPSPFIVLAMLALLDGLLQLLVLQPRVTKCQDEGASLLTLIKDPYILVAAGAITFANTGIGILEPALPLWMMDTMQAKNWEQGVAFLPAALSYLFSTNLFGNLGLRIGRWRSAMLGLVIIGLSLLLIPFASRVDHLILPNGAIGFAIGMVDSTMMPMLGYLVDIRHTSVYGSVYAIGDVAFCASFVFGPALSGTLVELIGFEGLIITTALICFAFAPLLILLKNPPARQLNEAQLQEQSTLRYVNYNQIDSPDEEAQLAPDRNYHHYHQNNASVASAKSHNK